MLQNRIDPWGRLCAVPDRGMLMGNRGILHNAESEAVRPWKHQAWVTCCLKFESLERPKPLWSSLQHYSELFFLDEATAFAAGHRPCNYCQRARSQEFKEAWTKVNAPDVEFVSTAALDKALHKERVSRDRSKRTFDAPAGELPMGTMFAADDQAFLVSPRGALPWSFAGYGSSQPIDASHVVSVLTPPSVVNAFRQGFVPRVHPSAE